jgi:delta14-sterol reductase
MTLALGITFGFLLHKGGIESFSWVYDNWVPLLSASLAMSAIQATWVYAYSFFSGELLALGGNSGNIIYDVRTGLPPGRWTHRDTS